MRRVRQTSSQVKLSKAVPMKVKFIPGVTKNPKFEHVGSRVAGLIRGLPKRASDDLALNNSNSRCRNESEMNGGGKTKSEVDFKPIWGANPAANARRSHATSATDLRKSESFGNIRRQNVPPVFRRKPKPLLPHEESVYNWRFSDTNSLSSNFAEYQRNEHPEKFAKFQNTKDLHVHRVEYLPCDGICAEETVECHNGDSGRSSSSSRTSRGINTEETRIYPEETLRQAQSLDRFEDSIDNSEIPTTPPSMYAKTRNLQTQTRTTNQVQNQHQHRSRQNGQGDGDFVNGFSNMKINGGGNHIPNTASNSKLNHVGPGGEQLPHKAGVVPKYLKNRQQQWKIDEETKKKEAAEQADVPAGHKLMPESERLQTMIDLKTSYDKLVNDLNRIPIHIDTIRIRDHKIQLEQQLTKLEQAMRIFSRPRVYVKNGI